MRASLPRPARVHGAALFHLELGVALVETADAVQLVGRAIGVILAIFEQLRMGAGHMVGFHEGFDRGFPVAVEDHPLPPFKPHLPEFERIEITGHGFEEFAERHAVWVHVDEDPAAPGIDLHFAEPGALLGQAPLPVEFVKLEGAFAVQVVAPAMEAAGRTARRGRAHNARRARDRPAGGRDASRHYSRP